MRISELLDSSFWIRTSWFELPKTLSPKPLSRNRSQKPLERCQPADTFNLKILSSHTSRKLHGIRPNGIQTASQKCGWIQLLSVERTYLHSNFNLRIQSFCDANRERDAPIGNRSEAVATFSGTHSLDWVQSLKIDESKFVSFVSLISLRFLNVWTTSVVEINSELIESELTSQWELPSSHQLKQRVIHLIATYFRQSLIG